MRIKYVWLECTLTPTPKPCFYLFYLGWEWRTLLEVSSRWIPCVLSAPLPWQLKRYLENRQKLILANCGQKAMLAEGYKERTRFVYIGFHTMDTELINRTSRGPNGEKNWWQAAGLEVTAGGSRFTNKVVADAMAVAGYHKLRSKRVKW